MFVHDNQSIESYQHPNCLLCGAPGDTLFSDLKDDLFGAPGLWHLKKCQNQTCGLVWLNPMPTEKEIYKAYQTYYTHESFPQENLSINKESYLKQVHSALNYLLLFASGQLKQKKALNYMFLDNKTPGKLLEVGCGNGRFLSRMQKLGWDVLGIDFDPNAVKTAQNKYKVPVRLGKLEDIGFSDSSFDAVTMNQVIEHVHDPISLMRECFRILKPNGNLVLITPNSESWGLMKFQNKWRGLEPPRHLFLFSQKTLWTCAMKAGFKEIKTWTTAVNAEYVFWGSYRILNKTDSGMAKAIQGLKSITIKQYENLLMAKYPEKGEEVVLIAKKTDGA